MATYTITTPVANLPFEMRQTFAGEFVFLKNKYVAYLLDGDSADLITDIDYPSYHTYTVTITRAVNTATATTGVPHDLADGMDVLIAGADQAAYNGVKSITVTGASTFTYAVAGAPATPATGTITAYGGWATVPGIVNLDDYIVVGRVDGEIHNCNRSAYTVWDALDFTVAEKEPSLLVAIAKSLNFLVAFKQWDTEFFYNAEQEPPGSPFLPQESAYLKLGLADGRAFIEFDGGIVFMSKRDQNQRSREIHILQGLTPKKVSTPEVERVLNASDLSHVRCVYMSTAGHQLFVMTLRDLELTLCMDMGNGYWGQLTKLTAQSSQSVSSLYREGNTAYATVVDHGFLDGDPVLIAGATPTAYNGTHNVTVIDDNTFSFPVEDEPTTPPTGAITATGYDESYFPAVAYATYQNLDLVLDESSGIIYSLEDEVYEDTGAPINVLGRLPPFDNNTPRARKTFSQIKPIGDLVDSYLLIRYSDDDGETWSKYRRVSLASANTILRKLGQGRRRIWEYRHTADTGLILEGLDQEFRQGF